ncbi:MAG: hypothetical protein K6B72_04065 [Lachnospiraceae bacterium]|nr:hypothetical protein [Lachnospiraceae bacterium]
MKYIKGIITRYPGLKLLSLLLAAVLWFLVTNMDNPTIKVRFTNIPVSIRNTGLIANQGKVYEVLDGTDTISSVEIIAPRSVADTFTRDNIIATADMNNLSSLNTLSINLTTNKYANQIESIRGSIDTVRLSIEDSKTRTLALAAKTTGSLQEGYIVGTISTEQNVIRITGPASLVDRAVTAVVSVDVTGFTSSIDTDAEIILLDEEGNEITDESVRKNIDDVRVNISILQTKRIPIKVSLSGAPADGYLLTGSVDISPDSVLVAGRGTQLQNLEELTLSGEEFDVTGFKRNLETSVNLRTALPTGVILGDSDFSGQVAVTAEIVQAEVKQLEMSANQIRIIDVPEGKRAVIQTEDLDGDGAGDGVVKVSVYGLPAALSSLQSTDISGTVDISELSERIGVEKPVNGTYTIPVTLTLPGGIYQSEELRVFVYIGDEET